MRYKAVLFDYDFTLADSAKAMDICYNTAIEEYGFKRVEIACLEKLSGRTPKEIFSVLTGLDSDSPILIEMLTSYQQNAERFMSDNTVIFDSVAKMAKSLTGAKYLLGIVSNKSAGLIETVLRRDGLLNYFSVIVGAPKKAKPDAYGILKAVTELGLSVSECVYVGDSKIDAQTAQNAGIDFIPVLTGATELRDFSAYTYVFSITDLSQLYGAIS